MIYECVDRAVENGLLADRKSFHPVPVIDEREKWTALDPEVKAYYDALSESLLNYAPSPLHASLYADYFFTGTRVSFERPYFERRTKLFACVICECIEDRGRFLNLIADILWAICEESTWVVPAHLYQCPAGDGKSHPLPDLRSAKAYIDLFAAETASILAWTRYLLGSRLDFMPALGERIGEELKARILDVYVQHPEMGWTGFNEGRKLNNWTPWIYSNLLAVILLSEEDPTRRNALVRLSAKGLDAFIAGYSPDGGCDEGPGYFDKAGASLFDALELFEAATGGQAQVWGEPIIKNILEYIMHVHISGNYYVNFADASCRVRPDALLLKRAAEHIEDPALEHFADYLLADDLGCRSYAAGYDSIYRGLQSVIGFKRRECRTWSRPDAELSHYFDGTQVVCVRQKPDGSGLFLAAKGGHNNESHNHNDIGNYIIYYDGEPFIIDVGVGTYTRRTFSPERYDIWTMQSGYHNTAIVGERDQLPGENCAARDASFTDDGDRAAFRLDMAPAYGEFSRINRYLRSLEMVRSENYIELIDRMSLSAEIPVILPVMCACEPRIAPGEVQLRGAHGILRILYDQSCFSVSSETVALDDAKLRNQWQRDNLYRLKFTCTETAPEKTLSLKFTV